MPLIDPEIEIKKKKKTIHFPLYPRNAKAIIINLYNDHKQEALAQLL